MTATSPRVLAGPSAFCRLVESGRDPRDFDLRGADLAGLRLEDVVLDGADLAGVDFRRSTLVRVGLREAGLEGADLRGARLLECRCGGADLTGASLDRARLPRADLKGACLAGARLPGADLSGADLEGADLTGADLRGADLRRTRLAGAVLRGTRLDGAQFHGSDLLAARVDGTAFARARGLAPEAKRVLVPPTGRAGGRWRVVVGWSAAAAALAAAAWVGGGATSRDAGEVPAAPTRAGDGSAATASTPPPPPDPNVRVVVVARRLPVLAPDLRDEGFERGDLAGWAAVGSAFDDQPTCLGDRSPLAGPDGLEGRCWIASHLTTPPGGSGPINKGDDPVGTLTSGPFRIRGGFLSFRVAGGQGPNTRVELLVDGEPVLEARGQDDGTLREVSWDLAPYSGREGRIGLVDISGGSFGRLEVDAIRLSPAPGRERGR